jgi:TetR/AcrR family transcriptional repressor of mexJK operon
MQKPCSTRSSAKREAILDAALACFLEHGYASTSMDMVAATAAVSKATIYAHFAGKDELFGAIVRRRCDTLACALDALSVSTALDARAALTALAHKLLTMLLDPGVLGIYRMVVAESARHPDLARAYYEAGPQRGKVRLAEVLTALADRGLLTVPDPLLAMDQFVGMLRGEHFNRALLGLPANEQVDLNRTVAGAVEAMLKAYAPS